MIEDFDGQLDVRVAVDKNLFAEYSCVFSLWGIKEKGEVQMFFPGSGQVERKDQDRVIWCDFGKVTVLHDENFVSPTFLNF